MTMIGCALLAAAVFTLDLFIKNHIEKTRTEGETELSRGGLVVFHKYHNRGAFLNLRKETGTYDNCVINIDACSYGGIPHNVHMPGQKDSEMGAGASSRRRLQQYL